MQDNFQKIMFTLSIILFLGIMGFFLFSRNFLGDKIRVLEEKQVMWQNEAIRREEINILDETLKELKSERVELESSFARKSDVVPLLNTIESMANAVSAKASISSVEVSRDNNFLVVNVRASGSFESLYKFLTLLENAPYQIDFSNVDFRRTVGDVVYNEILWEGSFGLRVLSFIP